MSIQINGKTFYSPSETAEKLGITVGMLRYHRNEGNIEGVEMGTITYYSDEQIQNAKLDTKKRGPKGPRKKEDDEGKGVRGTSVMFKRCTKAASLIGAAS